MSGDVTVCQAGEVFENLVAQVGNDVAPEELTADVMVSGPGGNWSVPAFCTARRQIRFRFCPITPGEYRWRSISSNPALAGASGEFRVIEYRGSNRLVANGAVSVSKDGRTFAFSNGTPFLWLGDTWWMALTRRLPFPDFVRLAEDRVKKGFNVVQIVAGLYPDMPYGDDRGRNEAGLPYAEDLSATNAEWWDQADTKIQSLIQMGLMPCIFGSWGYHLTMFGSEKMQMHWRNIVARWSAYPVTWGLAGEVNMAYYRASAADRDPERQTEAWRSVADYVKDLDPMKRLITVHPTIRCGRDHVDGTSIDFDMLQCGHDGRDAVPNTVDWVISSRKKRPAKPVVAGELIYEGILHDSDAEKIRLAWWASMLSGAAGFTYGANGIWQVNSRGDHYGPSPHGGNWGNTPWEEAMLLPGSIQVGASAGILRQFPWHQFRTRPEWVRPSAEDCYSYYAAGIDGLVRVVYLYKIVLPWRAERFTLVDLETDRDWTACWYDPRTGTPTTLGKLALEDSGEWEIPFAPEMKDYVLVVTSVTD